MPNKSKGFTLIETLVVITLIGAMTAYASFKYQGSSPFDLYSATQNLVLDMRLTKTLSMSLNKNYRIVFMSGNSYQIQDENNNPYTNPAANSATTTLANDITLTPLTTIVFNTLGQPMSASNVLLTSTALISITNGTTTNTITIEPQTGYVHE